ncbi:hypothetical protein [Legionella sp. 16cNR16C]|uniref:hypothetical protein n=1 Tax=Legionella sp. 16cNR16C TaxID=2905656 RepID=UPI001E3ED737|nr:hypothetical protein [Legionella sp. 16cNR16C]MCE3045566.1 hypothetical protein [Legionella sp. 16cNR16C]
MNIDLDEPYNDDEARKRNDMLRKTPLPILRIQAALFRRAQARGVSLSEQMMHEMNQEGALPARVEVLCATEAPRSELEQLILWEKKNVFRPYVPVRIEDDLHRPQVPVGTASESPLLPPPAHLIQFEAEICLRARASGRPFWNQIRHELQQAHVTQDRFRALNEGAPPKTRLEQFALWKTQLIYREMVQDAQESQINTPAP